MNFQNDFNKLNNKIQEVFKNWDNKILPGVRHFLLPKNFLKPYFRLIILSNFPYFYVVCAVCI